MNCSIHKLKEYIFEYGHDILNTNRCDYILPSLVTGIRREIFFLKKLPTHIL